jgi:tRNA G10  N-methylase Trm11
VVLGDATALPTSLPESVHGRIAGLVLDPPYGRNSHGSHGPWDLLARVLASAAEVVGQQGAGCCLILPVKPFAMEKDGFVLGSTEVEPLHGAWSDVLDLFDASRWELAAERWSVRVHGSLARLILHATCAPPS